MIVSFIPVIPLIDISPRTIFTQLVQLLSFLNLAMLPLVLSIRNPAALKQALVAYIVIMFSLAVLGLLQYLVYQGNGVNIFPIPRIGEDAQEEVLLNYIGDVQTGGLFRVTSLSMEPKNLAFYLAASIIFLIELKLSYARPVFGQFLDVTAIMVIFLCLILTYSTLGLAMLGVYISALLAFRLKSVIYLGVLAMVVFLFLYATGMVDLFAHIISGRLFDRIDSNGALEDFDIATWDFFIHNPVLIFTGVGLGNIHIVASDYLPWFADWAYGTRWHAKMGWLYVLSGSGILGLAFLSCAFLAGLHYLRNARGDHQLSGFAHAVLSFLAVLYFLRQNELAFLMLGFASAIYFHAKYARSIKGNRYES